MGVPSLRLLLLAPVTVGAGNRETERQTDRATDTPSKPSVVFFLTDDQDYIIGGFDQMEKTKRLIGDRGATFNNALIHSPICAVSRSELQSGRYLYNIKSNNLPTPVKKGMASAGNGGQHHVNYTGLVAQNNFGRYLHEQGGYTCGMFGKWMNEYNTEVAPGWDRWFAGMGEYSVSVSVSVSVCLSPSLCLSLRCIYVGLSRLRQPQLRRLRLPDGGIHRLPVRAGVL